ncbi:MAG TPA: myo-inosose-2 dehydratase [Casimicrobiaceae bacterium]|nr:myo-inosose-2 dehydratase [Casimicrobiaceae bacterium]
MFDVRIGINPISWTNDDMPALGGETPLDTVLSEGKAIGYEGFELGNKFPRDPDALRAVLARHRLACVSGWYSGHLARGTVADEIAAAEKHLGLLAATGASVMVYGEVADSIQGAPEALSRRPRFLIEGDWLAYGERLTAFARHTLARGLRLAYHHHMGAYVETAGDVERLMGVTGPEVGLLHDTGHVTFAGGDAPIELRKHVARVVHVHCKDVRPAVARMARNRGWSFLRSVLNGAFSTPGEGCVDFAAVIAILREAGYRGWLVVEGEQDPTVAPARRYAEMSFKLLSALVGGKSDAEARSAARAPARAAA